MVEFLVPRLRIRIYWHFLRMQMNTNLHYVLNITLFKTLVKIIKCFPLLSVFEDLETKTFRNT